MPTPSVSRQINAPASTVWSLLTDAQALVACECSILRIEGTITPGSRIKLWSEVDPKRAFPIKVAVFDRNRRHMEWHGGMPLGLFTGKRSFTLREQNGQTSFTMQETYSGPLKGLFTRLIPDLQPSFEKFADAIKRTTEEQKS